MATRRSPNEPKRETLIEVVLMFGLAFVVLFGFIWFLASAKIVYWTSGILRGIAFPWVLLDSETWQRINEAHRFYLHHPHQVALENYLAYANDCWFPWAFVLALWLIGVAVRRILRPMMGAPTLKRVLKPMELARELSKTFPAIIPVLHLGPDLIADKLPLWRRQTFPEDVWQKEKIDGKELFETVHENSDTGQKASRQRLVLERVQAYFRGDTKAGKILMRNGRRWSKMLGYLAVDLIKDAKRSNEICFADRFSSTGKVIYALLAAYAFGGRDGKSDYEKAAAQLNRSCAGQKNGLPNLTVAQWLYDKYRNNEQARKLFGVHHWEYTYLYALFKLAKRNGKITHTNFIWLKPQDRILFYVLNTVGRATPHTEAAAVFAQYDFEVQCARMKRLPLRVNDKGEFEPNIVVKTAVEALQMEFERYQNAQDDDDNWWKESSASIWEAAHALAIQERGIQARLRQAGAPQQTPFDAAAEAERRRQNAEDLVATLENTST